MSGLNWEKIDSRGQNFSSYIERAKVPGGWLLKPRTADGGGMTFYPDPNHKWDGNSLP